MIWSILGNKNDLFIENRPGQVIQDATIPGMAFLLESDSRILVALRDQNLLFDFDHNKLEFFYGTLFRFEWYSLMTFEEIFWFKNQKFKIVFNFFKAL